MNRWIAPLAGVGLLAVGAAAGAAAEHLLVRRGLGGGAWEEPFGSLRGRVVEVTGDDGTPLHVEVDDPPAGRAEDGLTVVFSHGYALNQDSWHFQRRGLQGLARLVFWDQRSHGRSGRGEFDTHHIDQLGRDLMRVLDVCAPTGPVVLVGHSMGGMTVMSLAAHHPEIFGSRVRGVALLATSAGGMSAETLGLPPVLAPALRRFAPSAAAALARQKDLVELGRRRGSDLGLLLTRLYSFGSAVPASYTAFVADMIAATPIDVIAEYLPTFDEHDKYAALEALQRCEVVVVVGGSDVLTPPRHSEEIVRRVPGAQLVVLPDTGHMLGIERPVEVNTALLGLLGRVRAHLPAPGERPPGAAP